MVVTVTANVQEFNDAIVLLAELAECFPQVVKTFIDGPEFLAKIRRVYCDRDSTLGAGNLRIIVKPSDFLIGFMAALRALDGYRLV